MVAVKRILITGATGNIGGQVLSQLPPTGLQVRALVRNPDAAGLPAHVEVVYGDLTRPETSMNLWMRLTRCSWCGSLPRRLSLLLWNRSRSAFAASYSSLHRSKPHIHRSNSLIPRGLVPNWWSG
jgi:NAD(P)H-binding